MSSKSEILYPVGAERVGWDSVGADVVGADGVGALGDSLGAGFNY
jgi:hypothetical protein